MIHALKMYTTILYFNKRLIKNFFNVYFLFIDDVEVYKNKNINVYFSQMIPIYSLYLVPLP